MTWQPCSRVGIGMFLLSIDSKDSDLRGTLY